jgi:peptidoglycan/LPS O-acetylase OafA/YrhL
MDHLNDIQNIWLNAPAQNLPQADAFIKKAKAYRSAQIIRHAALLIITLLLLAGTVWVMYDYRSHLWTTRAGEICYLVAIAVLLFANGSTLKRAGAAKDLSNREFLEFLKEEQKRRNWFQKRTKVFGFIVAAIGLLLYIYEPFRGDPAVFYPACLGVLAWIVLCWFIIRPRIITKSNLRLSETIKSLEALEDQLSN